MMPMSLMNPTPTVDDDIGPKFPKHANHVAQYFIAPNLFRLFGRLRISKILRAREIKFHAITARRRQQLLRTNQSQLRRLLRPQRILSAFAARQRQ